MRNAVGAAVVGAAAIGAAVVGTADVGVAVGNDERDAGEEEGEREENPTQWRWQKDAAMEEKGGWTRRPGRHDAKRDAVLLSACE